MGDVNGSAVGSLAKSSIQSSKDGILSVNPKDAIELPVKVNADMNVGALSLTFTYPANLVNYESISSKVQDAVISVEDGKIKMSWASLNSVNLKENDVLFTLKFKPTDQFKAGSKVDVDVNGVMADKDGNVVKAVLKSATIEVTIPAEFALRQNYPNPFNPTTIISYDLPAAGSVNLVVFNSLGQEVATLVNESQDAGIYKCNWNASNMTSGIYFYRINVKAGEKSYVKTQKMILMK